jgi:hypothetical protein
LSAALPSQNGGGAEQIKKDSWFPHDSISLATGDCPGAACGVDPGIAYSWLQTLALFVMNFKTKWLKQAARTRAFRGQNADIY